MGTLEELVEKRPAVKLELGQAITGTITRTSSQQSVDFDTQRPAEFDSGQPKMLAVFALDDGTEEKVLYVQWWGSQRDALQSGIDAFRKEHGRTPAPGDRMRVQYVRDETDADRAARGQTRKPPIPAKLYSYQFQAGVQETQAPTDVPF